MQVLISVFCSSEVFTINSDPKIFEQAGILAGVQHFGFRLKEPKSMKLLEEKVLAAGCTSFEHGTRGDKPHLAEIFKTFSVDRAGEQAHEGASPENTAINFILDT